MLKKEFIIYFIIFLFILVFAGSIIANPKVTGESITGVLKEESPEKLFDITVSLENSIILDIKDLSLIISFQNFGKVDTPINITFIILDEIGKTANIQQEQITVQTENVLIKTFEDLDLDYGKYKILIKTSYADNVEDEFWKEFEIRKSSEKSLFQLFDINFNIEENTLSDANNLIAKTEFTSFGAEPTPINLKYTILDKNENEIYNKEDYIIVETEEVIFQKFENLNLKNGEYSLILKTLYNVDVEDEFIRKFKIQKTNYYLIGLLASIFINISLTIFTFRIMKKKYNPKKKTRRKQVLNMFKII